MCGRPRGDRSPVERALSLGLGCVLSVGASGCWRRRSAASWRLKPTSFTAWLHRQFVSRTHSFTPRPASEDVEPKQGDSCSARRCLQVNVYTAGSGGGFWSHDLIRSFRQQCSDGNFNICCCKVFVDDDVSCSTWFSVFNSKLWCLGHLWPSSLYPTYSFTLQSKQVFKSRSPRLNFKTSLG